MRRIYTATAISIALSITASAEQKNIQLLTGLTDLEIQRTMNMMRGSLGVHCDYCHVVDEKTGWDFASDAKKEKETARDMIQMTEKLNHEQFGGRAVISCNTCHRGSVRPVSLLPLPQTAPPFPTPIATRPPLPSLDEVIKRYSAAIGDSSRLQAPRLLRGTREGSDGKLMPVELQEANGKVHVAITMPNGKLEQGFDTISGWSRGAKGVQKFSTVDIENFRELTAAYAPLLPSAIPKTARVVNKETIGDHDTVIVAANVDEKTRARYYFDTTTGLLVRRVIIKDTPAGPVPQQTDFDDYRDVGGTRFPYMVRLSLVDPWTSSTRRYTEVQLGAKIDETVFNPPAGNQPSS